MKPHRTLRETKWWFRWIRTLSWFSFRYYWFVWLLFLISLGLLIWCLRKPLEKQVCNASASMNLINRLEDQLEHCCNCGQPPEQVRRDSLHFPADYLVITYQFNASGGRDLDTRTEIFSPRPAGPLGYCSRGNSGGSLLQWSGDNTGSGVESCMIDLTNFGPADEIKVNCSAFWYGQKKSGKMSLDIRAYKGGTMELISNRYQFVNRGGNETAELSFSEKVNEKTCQAMKRIGVVSYNKQTERLDFQPD
jgi:hypothetical protein